MKFWGTSYFRLKNQTIRSQGNLIIKDFLIFFVFPQTLLFLLTKADFLFSCTFSLISHFNSAFPSFPCYLSIFLSTTLCRWIGRTLSPCHVPATGAECACWCHFFPRRVYERKAETGSSQHSQGHLFFHTCVTFRFCHSCSDFIQTLHSFPCVSYFNEARGWGMSQV